MKSSHVFFAVFIGALLCFLQPISGAGFCDGKDDGNYADPDNCFGYISCSNGITYHMPCPSGLKYNETTDQCDWPQNVKCTPVDGGWSDWSAWDTCTVTCGGGTQSRDRTCTNPSPSKGGANCVGSETETQECVTTSCPFSCQGRADGNYKDPDNCDGYISCSNGAVYRMPCPDGLYYNESTDQCDYPENVTC